MAVLFAALMLVPACGARLNTKPTTEAVTVMGIVVTPGPVPWKPGLVVADAIRLAGGFLGPEEDREDSDLRSSITRINGRERAVSFSRISTQTPLQPGDTLKVGRDIR